MVGVFTDDPQVIGMGAEYLRIISWNLAASGIVFVASSMFQAMGNTLPPLAASFARIVAVAIPAFALARLPGFELRWIWYLSVVAGAMQLAVIMLLLRREFRRRLDFAHTPSIASGTEPRVTCGCTGACPSPLSPRPLSTRRGWPSTSRRAFRQPAPSALRIRPARSAR